MARKRPSRTSPARDAGAGARVPAAAPPAAPAPGRRADRRLAWAVAASLVLHALALTVQFGFPTHKPSKDRSLDVVLVNARHARAPQQAEALAQANLDGGGNVDREVRAKSPLPPRPAQKEGDALVQARRRPAPPEPRQRPVLTQAKMAAPPAPAAPAPNAPPAEHPPQVSGLDLLDSAAAVARMEAEIDRKLEEYAKRPRRKFVGSRTKEYRFAQYVEEWRRKIERVGTLNYPEAARGKLYGSLMLSVTVRADGSVEKVEIHRSSGYKVLDDAAKRIVGLAAPFAPFPPDIRKDVDILEIVRTWTFTNTDQVHAN